jgi:hypothetical protein
MRVVPAIDGRRRFIFAVVVRFLTNRSNDHDGNSRHDIPARVRNWYTVHGNRDQRSESPSMSQPRRPPHAVPRTTRECSSSRLNDFTIRVALRAQLLQQHASELGTVLFEELGLCRGRVRVDIAVVNGSLCGYEIKSDEDNLHRLATQVDVYSKVLDRATLVVGQRLLTEALDTVPSWWGVLLAVKTSTGLTFRTVRRGRKNPKRDARALVELLWCDHAVALLEQRDAVRGFRGKPRRLVWDKLCELFELDEIEAAVCERLKARATLQALE